MSATAGSFGTRLDLLIKQGATFALPFQAVDAEGLPINLTGYVVRSQIRKTVKATAVTATFAPVINADPTTGLFSLRLTDAETSAITAGLTSATAESQYVWDLEIQAPDGFVTALAYGNVLVYPEVTR